MAYTSKDILDWFIANPNADAALINKTITDSKVTKQQIAEALAGKPAIAQKYLTAQILSQGTTGKWKGTGLGSAEANAADMAKIMADVGITDISQLGKITKTVDAPVQPVFGQGDLVTDNEGQQYYSQNIVGYIDQDGKPVDPNLVRSETVYSGGDAGTSELVYTAPVGKQEVFGNKLTGQEVANTYGERQIDNAFGGTYSGKGNTAYRVQFDATGNPVFYTTEASSSDAKDWMPIVQLALAATGAGGLLGNALLGAGANQVAAGALGGALLGGGTAALTGQDILKGALTGGAGGAISGYFNPATGQVTAAPVEGSIPVSGTDLGIDYSLANTTQIPPSIDMGGAQGLQAGTSANLTNMGGAQGFTFNAGAPVTSVAELVKAIDTMNGGFNPPNLTDMGGAQGLTYSTPSGVVTSTGTIPIGGLTGNTNVIGETGINTATNIGSTIGTTIPTTVIAPPIVPPVVPPVVPPATTPPVVPPVVPPTISDVIKTIGTVATVASLVNAVNPPTVTPPTTGFDIIPIPTDWKTPPKPTVAPYTPLTPIDFGTRNLLKGTQWEEFLSPNYGKVPAPVKYSQPSNLSYQDLMSILGSKQGMPPASSLSINDIISGIQNQYGQTPKSTMG